MGSRIVLFMVGMAVCSCVDEYSDHSYYGNNQRWQENETEHLRWTHDRNEDEMEEWHH